jgi:hypothetical protein
LQLEESNDFRFVTSEAEFEAIHAGEAAKYNRIVIFAELSWEGKNYSDFYGIDIAVSLRMESVALAPICMLSFLPKDYFAKKEEVKFNILKVRGTSFCRLPSPFETIENSLKSIFPLCPPDFDTSDISTLVKFMIARNNQCLPKIIRSPIPKWMHAKTVVIQITDVACRQKYISNRNYRIIA